MPPIESLEARRLLATFTVDATDDQTGQPGTNLREAVAMANAAAGPDTVVFSPTVFPGGAGTVTTTIALRSPPGGGPILVTQASELTIQGFADPARVRVSGGDLSGVFRVNVGTLTLRNLTVTNGLGTQSVANGLAGGGAVAVAPGTTLNASDCRFLDNNAASSSGRPVGGAVLGATGSTLVLTRCVFAGNAAAGGEGAAVGTFGNVNLMIADSRFEANGNATNNGIVSVQNSNSPVSVTGTAFAGNVNSAIEVFFTGSTTAGLTVRDSTFEGGTETPGSGSSRAAILVQSSASGVPITLTNTTISGNGYPGLRVLGGTATLTHCTIAGNRSGTSNAGGVVPLNSGPVVTLRNSVVVGNTRRINVNGAPTDVPADVLNVVNVSAGAGGSNNVIGDAQSSGGLTEGTDGNRVGKPGAPAQSNFLVTSDVFGPLGDYGGKIRTHAVLVAGRAYNAGSAANAAGIATDARGNPFARVANGLPDAGAFEVQTITPPRVSEARFDADGVNAPGFPQRLELRFETPIDGATLANFDLELTNLTTGQPVPTAAIRVDYEPLASRATFAFPGFAGAVLPDGNYRATLPAGSVADFAGTVQTEAYTIDFTVLIGDANSDRSVTFADLVTLAQNYGTGGHIFSEGNFDYDPDGRVDFADLVLLAQRYNTSLINPALTAVKTPSPGISSTAIGKQIVSSSTSGPRGGRVASDVLA